MCGKSGEGNGSREEAAGKGLMLFHVGSRGRALRNWRRKWGTNHMVSRGKLVLGIGIASAKALRQGCFCFCVVRAE